jgi:hypothetical protein
MRSLISRNTAIRNVVYPKTLAMVLFATVLGSMFGCGAEHFNGSAAADSGPTGSGGIGIEAEDAAVAIGTGAVGSGGAGTGGDTNGAGGAGSGGGGGAATDSAPDLPPSMDPGGSGGAAADTAPDLRRSVDAVDALPDTVSACVGGTRDLSNVGVGDFHISFHVVTTETGWVALLNQRSTCLIGVFWDIRQTAAGTILVETDNNSNASYQTVQSTIRINDGKPHDVVVTRVAGTISIHIDGTLSGQGPSSASLGSLPALRVGTDVCGATSNPPTAPFAGMTLSLACITRG